MKTRVLLLSAVASLALAGTAEAGWYISAEAGANMVSDNEFDFGSGPAPVINDFNNAVEYDTGWALLASLGHSFPGGWRAEVELGYRMNDMDMFSSAAGNSLFRNGEMTEFSVMANLLHDFPISPSMKFSLGVGVGMDMANVDDGIIDEGDSNIAYQGIVGFSHAISPTTDLFVNYRYFSADGPEVDGPHVAAGHTDTEHFESMTKHTLSVGFRFNM